MSDLVELLTKCAAKDGDPRYAKMLREAADVISRLTERLAFVEAQWDESSKANKRRQDDIDRLMREAASPPPPAAGDGVSLIAAERRRQREVEGYSEEHNDRHANGEMAVSAAAYALLDTHYARTGRIISDDGSCKPLKPKDPIRNLARAGALIAAEIDRLRRLEGVEPPSSPSR